MLTVNKLSESIVAWANTQLAIGRETCAILNELHRDFGLTDREIRDELGLEHLYPEDEPNETEEPLKEYHFVYHAYLDTVITVDAHNETEAEALAEEIAENNIIYADMECYDSGIEILPD